MNTARLLLCCAIALFLSSCDHSAHKSMSPEEKIEKLRKAIEKLDPQGIVRAKLCADFEETRQP